MITKKCQIRATAPITCFSVPIIGNTKLDLTSEEIYKCLCAKAEVLEILENGKTINLDFTNYNRDNSIIGEPIVIEKTSDTVYEELQKLVKDTPVDVTENNFTIVDESDEVVVGDTISTEHENEPEVIISASENTTTDYEAETTSTTSEAYIVKDRKYENKKNKNKKK